MTGLTLRCVWRRVSLARTTGCRGSAMPVRRLDEAGLAAVQARRWVMPACWPGTGPISSRCRAVSACGGRTRSADADAAGSGWREAGSSSPTGSASRSHARGGRALADAALLGHRCDNPLCQRIATGHVAVSSALRNRRDWSIRRNLPDSPLADPRGPRRRARELRDMVSTDPEVVAADMERLRQLLGEQLALW